jgi:exodeoxyribonuclease III
MKIASFNINDINRRLSNLLHWLREAEPDIVCLQELKAADADFPAQAIRQAGYHAVWHGERRWNGVAILTRCDSHGLARRRRRRAVQISRGSGQRRARRLDLRSQWKPAAGTQIRLQAGVRRLNAHAAELYGTGAPVVLAGDYNIVPTDLDIYPSKSWDRNALLQPESRAAYQALLAKGWTDAIRVLHPKERVYTFWDYMRQRWGRDGGLRLDHILLSSALTERLQSAGVDRQTRGLEDASDHAPVWVILKDCPGGHGGASRHANRQTNAATTTRSPKTT